MHELTDSPLMVGLVSTATLGPVLLLSMWGGVVADRVNRLVLVRCTRGMFSFLALLTGLLVLTDAIEVWHILSISAATGILLSFDIPSRSAMLPALIPSSHLASAIAMYSLVFGGAAILGPALLSPLVNLWGLEGVFFLIGAAYALTVLALLLMNPKGHQTKKRVTTIMGGMVEGFQYLRHHTFVLGVIAIGIVSGIFGNSFEVLLPVYTNNVLAGGIETYSELLLAVGIGGLAATLTIAVLGSRVRPAAFFICSSLGYGLTIFVLPQMVSLVSATIVIALIGAFHVIFGTMSITLIQTLTEDEFLGRIMSVHQLSWGATAVGGVLMGAIAETWGISTALTICGITLVVATSVLWATFLRVPLIRAGERGSP
jgi:MFS family permease